MELLDVSSSGSEDDSAPHTVYHGSHTVATTSTSSSALFRTKGNEAVDCRGSKLVSANALLEAALTDSDDEATTAAAPTSHSSRSDRGHSNPAVLRSPRNHPGLRCGGVEADSSEAHEMNTPSVEEACATSFTSDEASDSADLDDFWSSARRDNELAAAAALKPAARRPGKLRPAAQRRSSASESVAGRKCKRGRRNLAAAQGPLVAARGVKECHENDEEDGEEEDEDSGWPKLGECRIAVQDLGNANPLVLKSKDGFQTYEVPSRINAYLRDYQRQGVKFMFKCISRGTKGGPYGCILNDDMGLGKTVQVIALLSALYCKTATRRDRTAVRLLQRGEIRGGASSNRRRRGLSHGPTLIVAPASLVRNWQKELRRWGCFHLHELGGIRGYDAEEEKERVLQMCENETLEIVVCSYEAFKKSSRDLSGVHWRLLIFDECHLMKNPKAKTTIAASSLRCKRRIGLTGTLMQNKLIELWCVVDAIAKNYLRDMKTFREWYEKPILRGVKATADSATQQISKDRSAQLRRVLTKIRIRRTKDGCVKDQLPTKRDRIVFVPLSRLQRRVYERVLKSRDAQLVIRAREPCDCGRKNRMRRECCYDGSGEGEKAGGVVLSKVANHLDLLKAGPKEDELSRRFSIAKAKEFFGEDQAEVGGTVIDTGKGNKVLIFSNSKQLLDILQGLMVVRGWLYSRLDGDTAVKKRQDLVDEFNDNTKIFVFLMSTKAGGVGLNLTAANIVVNFDPSWNPSYDLQAQDRAYRLGQSRDVSVYRFMSQGTVEEIAYTRQLYKMQLAEAVLDEDKELGPRMFEGVAPEGRGGGASTAASKADDEGMIFGVRNLFSYREGGILAEIQARRARDSCTVGAGGSLNGPYKRCTEELGEFTFLNNSVASSVAARINNQESLESTTSDTVGSADALMAKSLLECIAEDEKSDVADNTASASVPTLEAVGERAAVAATAAKDKGRAADVVLEQLTGRNDEDAFLTDVSDDEDNVDADVTADAGVCGANLDDSRVTDDDLSDADTSTRTPSAAAHQTVAESQSSGNLSQETDLTSSQVSAGALDEEGIFKAAGMTSFENSTFLGAKKVVPLSKASVDSASQEEIVNKEKPVVQSGVGVEVHHLKSWSLSSALEAEETAEAVASASCSHAVVSESQNRAAASASQSRSGEARSTGTSVSQSYSGAAGSMETSGILVGGVCWDTSPPVSPSRLHQECVAAVGKLMRFADQYGTSAENLLEMNKEDREKLVQDHRAKDDASRTGFGPSGSKRAAVHEVAGGAPVHRAKRTKRKRIKFKKCPG